MTCKDCIHYCLCKDTLADENWREDTPQEIKDMYSPKGCENFKNKDNFKEVKHGKWIDTDTFDSNYSPIYQCSECYKEVADNYISCHKYCLHCGTKMYKEK